MIIVDLNSSQLHHSASWAYGSAAGLVEEERLDERRTKDRGGQYDPPGLDTALDCAAACGEEALSDTTPEGRRHSLRRAIGWLTIALALHDAEVAASAKTEGT